MSEGQCLKFEKGTCEQECVFASMKNIKSVKSVRETPRKAKHASAQK